MQGMHRMQRDDRSRDAPNARDAPDARDALVVGAPAPIP